MNQYTSWRAFCDVALDQRRKSGLHLMILYGAGGVGLLIVAGSMLGFSRSRFIELLLDIPRSPSGWIVAAAILLAAALPILVRTFSDRMTLASLLRQLADAKPEYEYILLSHPSATSQERVQAIDTLLGRVLHCVGKAGGQGNECEGVMMRLGAWAVVFAEGGAVACIGVVALLFNASPVSDSRVDIETLDWWGEAGVRFALTLPAAALVWIIAFAATRWIAGALLRWPSSRAMWVATTVTSLFLFCSACGALLFGVLKPHF